jgi:LysR family transcriptional regulator (chromosome initiation inhibitor)
MGMEMLDRLQLETFGAVIEQGSFEAAARALHVSHGAVSQRIRALEEALSTVLLFREIPVVPTQTGQILLKYVKELRLLELETIRRVRPTGGLRTRTPIAVAVNADSLATWFEPIAWSLIREHHVALEVFVDDQDHTYGLLARGEVMGCVSARRQKKLASGFEEDHLGTMVYRCVAHPSFMRQYFANGLSLLSLVSAPAVLFNRKDRLHDMFLESVFGVEVTEYAKHYVPSPHSLLAAVREGVGYGLVPQQQCGPLISREELRELAPQHAVAVDLYWYHWKDEPRLASTVTRTLIDQAKHWLSV